MHVEEIVDLLWDEEIKEWMDSRVKIWNGEPDDDNPYTIPELSRRILKQPAMGLARILPQMEKDGLVVRSVSGSGRQWTLGPKSDELKERGEF